MRAETAANVRSTGSSAGRAWTDRTAGTSRPAGRKSGPAPWGSARAPTATTPAIIKSTTAAPKVARRTGVAGSAADPTCGRRARVACNVSSGTNPIVTPRATNQAVRGSAGEVCQVIQQPPATTPTMTTLAVPPNASPNQDPVLLSRSARPARTRNGAAIGSARGSDDCSRGRRTRRTGRTGRLSREGIGGGRFGAASRSPGNGGSVTLGGGASGSISISGSSGNGLRVAILLLACATLAPGRHPGGHRSGSAGVRVH